MLPMSTLGSDLPEIEVIKSAFSEEQTMLVHGELVNTYLYELERRGADNCL
jgi:hypothetical protein